MNNTLNIPWEIQTHNVYTGIYHPDAILTKEYKALHRSDNQMLLNLCKKSYTPFTNKQLEDFIFRLTEYGFDFLHYSEFKEGKKQLIKLKAPEFITEIAGHKIEGDFIVGNSHDGSSSLFVSVGYTYYACMNRFRLPKALSIYHTPKIEYAVQEFMRGIKRLHAKHQALVAKGKRWQKVKIDHDVYELAMRSFLDIDKNDRLTDLPTRTQNRMLELSQCMNDEIKIHGQTQWSLFNGFTRYTTHHSNNFDEYKLNKGSIFTKNNKALEIVEAI